MSGLYPNDFKNSNKSAVLIVVEASLRRVKVYTLALQQFGI
jgi:hypothetical protein